MYRLLINLYEFGQFLRILLWISVPLVVISMLVTTWLHYRRKRRLPEELLLSLPGMDGVGRLVLPTMLASTGEASRNGQESFDGETFDESSNLDAEQKENIYKGILWMKEKYEQYRDMADGRYHQLKEQLARTEKKYQELLEAASRPPGPQVVPASPATEEAHPSPAEPVPYRSAAASDLTDVEKASYPALLEEKNRQIGFLQQQLDQRIKNYYQAELEGRENKSRMLEFEEAQLRTLHLVEEKQAYIDQLEGQLVAERRKIEDLVTKLQASSQQLLTIYQELDKSFKPADAPGAGEPQA